MFFHVFPAVPAVRDSLLFFWLGGGHAIFLTVIFQSLWFRFSILSIVLHFVSVVRCCCVFDVDSYSLFLKYESVLLTVWDVSWNKKETMTDIDNCILSCREVKNLQRGQEVMNYHFDSWTLCWVGGPDVLGICGRCANQFLIALRCMLSCFESPIMWVEVAAYNIHVEHSATCQFSWKFNLKKTRLPTKLVLGDWTSRETTPKATTEARNHPFT